MTYQKCSRPSDDDDGSIYHIPLASNRTRTCVSARARDIALRTRYSDTRDVVSAIGHSYVIINTTRY